MGAELQALITERYAMLAENESRASRGVGQAYGESEFFDLADKMRACGQAIRFIAFESIIVPPPKSEKDHPSAGPLLVKQIGDKYKVVGNVGHYWSRTESSGKYIRCIIVGKEETSKPIFKTGDFVSSTHLIDGKLIHGQVSDIHEGYCLVTTDLLRKYSIRNHNLVLREPAFKIGAHVQIVSNGQESTVKYQHLWETGSFRYTLDDITDTVEERDLVAAPVHDFKVGDFVKCKEHEPGTNWWGTVIGFGSNCCLLHPIYGQDFSVAFEDLEHVAHKFNVGDTVTHPLHTSSFKVEYIYLDHDGDVLYSLKGLTNYAPESVLAIAPPVGPFKIGDYVKMNHEPVEYGRISGINEDGLYLVNFANKIRPIHPSHLVAFPPKFNIGDAVIRHNGIVTETVIKHLLTSDGHFKYMTDDVSFWTNETDLLAVTHDPHFAIGSLVKANNPSGALYGTVKEQLVGGQYVIKIFKTGLPPTIKCWPANLEPMVPHFKIGDTVKVVAEEHTVTEIRFDPDKDIEFMYYLPLPDAWYSESQLKGWNQCPQ